MRRKRPAAAPPLQKPPALTYAVVRVPDGEVLYRGGTRDQADELAEIWNTDRDAPFRAAVIPDADLRGRQPTIADVDTSGPREIRFPKLPVAIHRDGQTAEIVFVDDPRIEWCQRFNEAARLAAAAVGTFATPLYLWIDPENEMAEADQQ